MSKKTKKQKMNKLSLPYLLTQISTVLGLVLIWRGIWHILDEFDDFLFNGNPFWTASIGIFIGLLVLYLPDKDLKEIEKL
jgi:hypothetical protein